MLDGKRYQRFSELITRELGIRMPASKRSMLENRLIRRARQLKLASVDEYEQYLFDSAAGSEEFVHFLDLATTNKTEFFREPAQFEYLCSSAVPTLLRERRPDDFSEVRVWCAGCSAGQEVYTLAIVLSEFAATRRGFEFSVLGTDISTRVLDQALRATYPEEGVDRIPMALRKKYLLRSKDRDRALVRIAPQLRRRVRFGRLNFMSEEYGLPHVFDVIFFRNVMIYFDKQTQARVIERLCSQLSPGGYLFVGLSESLAGIQTGLVSVASSVFRKLR